MANVDSDATREAVAATAKDNIWVRLKEKAYRLDWEKTRGNVVTNNIHNLHNNNYNLHIPQNTGAKEANRTVMMVSDRTWHDYPPYFHFTFVCQIPSKLSYCQCIASHSHHPRHVIVIIIIIIIRKRPMTSCCVIHRKRKILCHM